MRKAGNKKGGNGMLKKSSKPTNNNKDEGEQEELPPKLKGCDVKLIEMVNKKSLYFSPFIIYLPVYPST